MKDILQSKSTWKILNKFFSEPWREIYVRALLREVKIGPNIAVSTLDRLRKDGLLKTKKTGTVIFYALNENNELIKKLLMLYHEKKLSALPEEFMLYISRLRRKLENGKILSAVLFGSVASGKSTTESDIDILIVVDGKFDTNAVKEIFYNFSRYVQIIDFSRKEFEKNYHRGHELIVNMIRDGIIILDNNFFYKYLFKPIPKPTRDYLENILLDAEKKFKNLIDIRRKKIAVESLFYPIINRIATLFLLLNNQIPQSRKHIIIGLEKLGEDKLAKWLKKIRKIWDGEIIKLSDEEEEELIDLLQNKLKECYMRLEKYG